MFVMLRALWRDTKKLGFKVTPSINRLLAWNLRPELNFRNSNCRLNTDHANRQKASNNIYYLKEANRLLERYRSFMKDQQAYLDTQIAANAAKIKQLELELEWKAKHKEKLKNVKDEQLKKNSKFAVATSLEDMNPQAKDQ